MTRLFATYTHVRNMVFENVSKTWQRWDLNPRPFGLEPKSSALDRSATLPRNFLRLIPLTFSNT